MCEKAAVQLIAAGSAFAVVTESYSQIRSAYLKAAFSTNQSELSSRSSWQNKLNCMLNWCKLQSVPLHPLHLHSLHTASIQSDKFHDLNHPNKECADLCWTPVGNLIWMSKNPDFNLSLYRTLDSRFEISKYARRVRRFSARLLSL